VIGGLDVLAGKLEEVVHRPLVVGVHAVLAGQDVAVGRDQEVGGQPERLLPAGR
jgi:hypothetical protein